MQDSIKQRLTLFINNKNISTREFERNCHLSNGYINSMKKGLGLEKLENILHYYPELNREWLLAGKGEMIKGSISLNEASEQKIESSSTKIESSSTEIESSSTEIESSSTEIESSSTE